MLQKNLSSTQLFVMYDSVDFEGFCFSGEKKNLSEKE